MILFKVSVAFLLFIPISCVAEYCYCQPQTIGDVDEIMILSQGYPHGQCNNGTCTWKIMPHPEKDILLEVQDIKLIHGNKLEIHHVINQQNNSAKKFKLYTYDYDTSYNYPKKFKIPKNSGLELVATHQPESYYYYQRKGFKAFVKRVENNEASCGQSYNLINKQTQFIEKSGNVETSCLHQLVSFQNSSAQNGKILLAFEGMDESIADLHYLNDTKNVHKIRDDTAFLVNSDNYLLQIESRVTGDTSYNRPTISAQYVGERCNCDNTTVEIPRNVTIRLESPGYPDLYCPGLSCQTTIKTDRTPLEGMVDILLFSFENVSFRIGDSLEISRAGKVFYTLGHMPFLTTFVSSHQDHKINYRTTNTVQERRYVLNITRISIPEECRCSSLGEKQITKKSKFSMIISLKCNFVYCSWDVLMGQNSENDETSSSRTIIEFYVKNAHSKDKVEIDTEGDNDIFQQGDLKYKRSYSTGEENCHFLFTQDARDSIVKENTELSIQWRYEKIMNCKEDTKVIRLTTTPFVLASQQWPDVYRNDEECRYLFNAPEGHTIHVLIDEIHLESHHDSVQFYQGNTTDDVFKSFTGSHANMEFDSETNQMVFEFTTDGSDVDKGFHMNLVAVKKTGLLTTASSTTVTTVPPTTTSTTTSAPTTKVTTTVMSETTTHWLDDDPELLTGTEIMEEGLKDSEAKLMNPDEMDNEPTTTSIPQNLTKEVNGTGGIQKSDVEAFNSLRKASESSFLYFWIVSLCFNVILIGALVYKYRSSLRAHVGHAIQFSRNEFGSFVSISRSEQSQQTTTTDATETTEMNDLQA